MTATDQPQMMPLRVMRNDKIADGIHLLEFRDAGGQPLSEFSAGAHITIRVPNGALRKYSLCSDPAERDRYTVAVKREANGRGGSSNLIDNVKAGDELMVAAPVNDFGLPPRAQDFLFIAGGIGITPIMAMIRQVQAEGKRFRLFYCTRSPETAAFVDELSKPDRAARPVKHRICQRPDLDDFLLPDRGLNPSGESGGAVRRHDNAVRAADSYNERHART